MHWILSKFSAGTTKNMALSKPNYSRQDKTIPGPMLEEHKQLLQKFRTKLTKNLDVLDIRDHLIENGIVTKDMMDNVMSERSRAAQVSALLDLLERRGNKAFGIFLESLKVLYDFLYVPLLEEASKVSRQELEDPYVVTNFDAHYYYLGLELLNMFKTAAINKDRHVTTREERWRSDFQLQPPQLPPPPALPSPPPPPPQLTYDPGYETSECDYSDICSDDESYMFPLSDHETYSDIIQSLGNNRDDVKEENFVAIIAHKTKAYKYSPELLEFWHSQTTGDKSSESGKLHTKLKIEQPQDLDQLCLNSEDVMKGKTIGNVQCTINENSLVSNPLKLRLNDDIPTKSYKPEEDSNGITKYNSQETLTRTSSTKDVEILQSTPLAMPGQFMKYKADNQPAMGLNMANCSGDKSSNETTDDSQSQIHLRHEESLFPFDTVEMEKGDMVVMNPCDEDILGYRRVYDRAGKALMVPVDCLKKYGDPSGEPWFYPVSLPAGAAKTLLKDQPVGTYIFHMTTCHASLPDMVSLVIDKTGKVKHFRIHTGHDGSYFFQISQMFENITDLHTYYQHNRGCLPCRLRRLPMDRHIGMLMPHAISEQHVISQETLKFQNNSELGKGASSLVQKAHYGNLPVAVKTLQASGITILDTEDFLSEGKILLSLKHENIVHCYGVSVSSDKDLSLIFGYCEQKDLRKYIKSNTGKEENSFDKTLMIGRQLLLALQYLESKHIIHRDIACRNIFLTSELQVKLGDFGMARYVVDDVYIAESYESVPVRWASPEVLTQLKYSSKSDMYAAGVAFWEMFSGGEKPYEGLSGIELCKAIRNSILLEKPEKCPLIWYCRMKKCWAQKPRDRPSPSWLLKEIDDVRKNYYEQDQIVPMTEETGVQHNSERVYEYLQHQPGIPSGMADPQVESCVAEYGSIQYTKSSVFGGMRKKVTSKLRKFASHIMGKKGEQRMSTSDNCEIETDEGYLNPNNIENPPQWLSTELLY